MDTPCRLCGSEDGIKVNIFEPGTDHVRKIHKILPIIVNEHDPLPKTMCHRCSFKVNEFFEFRTNCIKAQEVFKSRVPWLRDKQTRHIVKGHPPMVELALNTATSMSLNEKQLLSGPRLVEENNGNMIEIEDDSSPLDKESSQVTDGLLNENGTDTQLETTIKKAVLKKKYKSRSIWDTKKRKKKPRKSYRITEVYTTSMDEYRNIGDIENDPLRLSPVEKYENKTTFSYADKSPKREYSQVEKNVLTNDKAGENITLPKHILVTNIPRVGFVYTCEICGRTFLSPQPASLHICDHLEFDKEDVRSVKDEHDASSNSNEFYSCNECGQGFTRHSQLLTHQKKHYKEDSSTDDNFTPFNHRRKFHTKKKAKPRLLSTSSVVPTFDQMEPVIITRHSLLSSDSD